MPQFGFPNTTRTEPREAYYGKGNANGPSVTYTDARPIFHDDLQENKPNDGLYNANTGQYNLALRNLGIVARPGAWIPTSQQNMPQSNNPPNPWASAIDINPASGIS